MYKHNLTVEQLNKKLMPAIFNREVAFHVTDGTIEKDRECYNKYRAFFDANSTRHSHILAANWHQFDAFEELKDFLLVPCPYVKVSQTSPGIFEYYLCYFGREFDQLIREAKTDTDIAHILLKMQLCRGAGAEMMHFVAQAEKNHELQIAAAVSTNSKHETVN
jgi:hypothetical protein